MMAQPLLPQRKESAKKLTEIHNTLTKQDQVKRKRVTCSHFGPVIFAFNNIADTAIACHKRRPLFHRRVYRTLHEALIIKITGITVSIAHTIFTQQHLTHASAKCRHLIDRQYCILCHCDLKVKFYITNIQK